MPEVEREVTAIRSALYRGDRAGALALVSDGAQPNLFDLAALGDADAISRTLAAEPDAVNARSADGFTALHFAAFLGGADAVKVLLDAGASVSAVSDNDMQVQPLHSAAALGDLEACRLLLAAGADPNARQVGDHTALHEAALTGNAELVDLLLEAGADPSARNHEGRDAGTFATENGHIEITKRLRTRETS